MSVDRNPRHKLRPLISAMRIVPLVASVPMALSGMASAATIEVTGTDDGSCTIGAAVDSINHAQLVDPCTISDAQAFGDNDIVDLSGFTEPTEILFSNVIGSSALSVFVPATISGNFDVNGVPLVTLSRPAYAANFRLIRAFDRFTLSGVALKGGYAADGLGGGAILATPNTNALLTLTHAVISGNASARDGGGIVSYANVVVSHSLISGNTAQYHGGGISQRLANGMLLLNDSTIDGNYAMQDSGGGIYSQVNVNLANSVVSNNFSGALGGGVYSRHTVAVLSSAVTSNASVGAGGGVYGHQVNLTKGNVGNNYSNANGGGIASNFTNLIGNSTITGNRAHFDGGGIFASVTAVAISSTISGNSSRAQGGGIFAGHVFTTNSTVSGNRAVSRGAGIYANLSANLLFTTVAANTLTGTQRSGAGLFVGSSENVISSADLTASLVFGNAGATDFDANNLADGLVDGNHNLIGTFGAHVGVPDDTLRCDPQLGPLGDNGGLTQTQALPVGSCAIDAGPDTTFPADDQRGPGFTRESGASTDIGAFEFDPPDRVFYDGFDR